MSKSKFAITQEFAFPICQLISRIDLIFFCTSFKLGKMPKSPLSDVVIPEIAVHEACLHAFSNHKDKTALVSRSILCLSTLFTMLAILYISMF